MDHGVVTRQHPRTRRASEAGASVIEAIVAAAIVVTVTAGTAHLLVWARRAAWTAGVETAAVSMGVQKMEQLRSLAWYVDAAGAPVSDSTTSLAHDPATAGGPGLGLSPGDALERDTPGFVDYLDPEGRWCGTGARRPSNAAFVRRWAVERFGADPADTLILTVVVVPVVDAAAGDTLRSVRLQTLRTRVPQ